MFTTAHLIVLPRLTSTLPSGELFTAQRPSRPRLRGEPPYSDQTRAITPNTPSVDSHPQGDSENGDVDPSGARRAPGAPATGGETNFIHSLDGRLVGRSGMCTAVAGAC